MKTKNVSHASTSNASHASTSNVCREFTIDCSKEPEPSVKEEIEAYFAALDEFESNQVRSTCFSGHFVRTESGKLKGIFQPIPTPPESRPKRISHDDGAIQSLPSTSHSNIFVPSQSTPMEQAESQYMEMNATATSSPVYDEIAEDVEMTLSPPSQPTYIRDPDYDSNDSDVEYHGNYSFLCYLFKSYKPKFRQLNPIYYFVFAGGFTPTDPVTPMELD